jgi:hypothetical protein
VHFAVIFCLDAAISAVSLWLAMLLRFDGAIAPDYAAVLPQYITLLVASRLLAAFFWRIHRWSF